MFRFVRIPAWITPALFPLAVGAEDFAPPPGYYDRAFGLTGDGLEAVLHEIIRDHTVQPYTQAFQGDAWDALKVLDRDPDDASRVIEVFSGTSVPADDTGGGGNPNITGNSWVREHLWPRSYGVGSTGADYSDLFNLRPSNPQVNQTRGNRIFDDPAAVHVSDPAVAAPGAPECLYDAGGGQGGLWGPRPIEKAEIARAMFYMQVRYDGRDDETMALSLSDEPSTAFCRFGRLSALLDWHGEMEVSQAERRRNQLLFTEYQGNRNPFVDDPGFVNRVFSGAPPPSGLNVMLSRPVLALNDGSAALSGVVTLSETATTNTVVELVGSSEVSGLSLPESVTVQAGQRTATFTMDATAVAPPGFASFREDWSVTASAPGYGADQAGITLLGAAGRGWETFDRLLIYGSTYRDGSFTGQNGVRWNFVHATPQQNFPIDGRGILLRNEASESRIVSDPISGGIGSLAIDLRKAFTGTGSRQVEVLINGVSRGFSPTFGAVSGENATVLTYTLNNLNVAGDFTMEIRNASGGQLVVDDIRWAGWPGGSAPSPEIVTFPGGLAAPGYTEDSGPGEDVRFRIFGLNLGAGELMASAPAGFEIALDGGAFAGALQLPEASDGMTSIFLRARLQENLPPGDYAAALVVSGGGADAVEMNMSGSVVESTSHLFPGLLAGGYQQDFSGFAASGELPFGWEVTANGSASNRLDISAWGNSTTGIKRGSIADPVLGYQHTTTTGTAVMRLQLENRSGNTVKALDIQYLARAERLGLIRYPQFTTRLNGGTRSALAHNSADGDGVSKRDRLGGLSIPPGGMIELTWTSNNGAGSGASRQIGLSDLDISLPAPPVVTLSGPAEFWLEQGGVFDDPGAVAADDFDGAVAVSVSGLVDVNTPGITLLSYGAVNSVGLPAETVQRSVTVLRPFDYFMQVTHGLMGDAAATHENPTGDGVVNLLKFAFGGDPNVADPSVLPDLVILPDGRPALRFRIGPAMAWDPAISMLAGAGLEISLLRSNDLVEWIPVATELLAQPPESPIAAGSEILLAAIESSEPGRVFLRLEVRLAHNP